MVIEEKMDYANPFSLNQYLTLLLFLQLANSTLI